MCVYGDVHCVRERVCTGVCIVVCVCVCMCTGVCVVMLISPVALRRAACSEAASGDEDCPWESGDHLSDHSSSQLHSGSSERPC